MNAIASFAPTPVVKQFTDSEGREVVHLRGREVAADVGNTEGKFLFGPEKRAIVIPNVVAEMEFKDALEREQSVLEALRVKIDSPALKREWGTMAVGILAARQNSRKEIPFGSIKAEEDQAVILLLTGLAVDAVYNFPVKNGVCYATYCLSTGLPISEYRDKELKKQFRKKLTSGIHTVKFLETADPHNGVEVRIQIFDVKVISEGQAAHLELTTDEYGKYKPMPKTDGTYLIFDDGGGTLDVAVMLEGGKPDNERSEGYDRGINEVLDRINKEIYDKFKETFESRKKLSEHILKSRKKDPKRIDPFLVKGKKRPIQDIVDKHFNAYAEQLYRVMAEKWRGVSGCQAAYFVGGASALIRPYLVELNGGEGEAGEYVIYFVEPGKSFWVLAQAYYKIGRVHRVNNKKRKIELLPPC